MAVNETHSLEEIKKMAPSEAIPYLDKLVAKEPENEEAYLIRGLRHWSLNHRQLAINDYLMAIKLNPESKAKMALQYANSILDYYNKDLYNP